MTSWAQLLYNHMINWCKHRQCLGNLQVLGKYLPVYYDHDVGDVVAKK